VWSSARFRRVLTQRSSPTYAHPATAQNRFRAVTLVSIRMPPLALAPLIAPTASVVTPQACLWES